MGGMACRGDAVQWDDSVSSMLLRQWEHRFAREKPRPSELAAELQQQSTRRASLEPYLGGDDGVNVLDFDRKETEGILIEVGGVIYYISPM